MAIVGLGQFVADALRDLSSEAHCAIRTLLSANGGPSAGDYTKLPQQDLDRLSTFLTAVRELAVRLSEPETADDLDRAITIVVAARGHPEDVDGQQSAGAAEPPSGP